MRIVVCNSQVPFEYGGAEILAGALCEQLRVRGHEVDLVQIPQQWEPRAEIVKNYLVWRLLSLTHTYTQEPIDRVICLKYPAYAVQHPRKVTWLVHQLRQAYDLYGSAFGFLENTAEDRETRAAVTRMDTTTIAESYRVHAISANVARRLWQYNGIEASVLHPPPALDGRLRCEAYGDYVLSVSRLAPIKRVDLLIQALALVETPVRCLICGTGIDSERLQQLAVRLRVQDRCQFLGFVDNESLIALYARCLAAYYAPVDEDYGLATVEAMKAHKPVLTATDSGGTLEFVLEGETGYVFEPQTPAQLAQRLDELYEHRDLARRLGDRGADLVSNITWDHTIARLLED
jgi:glycosyltransferase involved in cell wall biosynthesis